MCFVLNLIEIRWVNLEKIVFYYANIVLVLHYWFIMICAWTLNWTALNFLHQSMPCVKFGWIWPGFWEMTREMWKKFTIAQAMMIVEVGQFRSKRLTHFISSGELEHYEDTFLWIHGQHFAANKGRNLSFKSIFSQSNFVSNVVFSL